MAQNTHTVVEKVHFAWWSNLLSTTLY